MLWLPLSRTPAYFDITIISAISALIFLVIFKKTSNQEMIKLYKGKMMAHILEIRLYKDQPILTLKSIGHIIWYNIIYLRYTLRSLLVIFVPLLILCIQINNHYGYRPIEPDKPFIVRVNLNSRIAQDSDDMLKNIHCQTSGGIELETGPMVITSEASVLWRGRVINSAEGEFFCQITIGDYDQNVEKRIITGSANQRFSPQRTKWHLRNVLVDNAEDFIPAESPFESIRVQYERAHYPFLFWNMDVIILYFVLTLILGFVFKPFLKVTF